ncbi:unnamed protein product [Tilletia controversa]|nr:unnamed protein product [Tilletia controversa]
MRLVKFGDSLFRCKQLKRAALGRMPPSLRGRRTRTDAILTNSPDTLINQLGLPLHRTVRPRQGTGFCHLAKTRTSCFGAREGFAKLEETLLARVQNAPEGSYTQRLFREPELLAAKLREETSELIEAKDSEPEHVAFEAADLLYFTLVRCFRAGISLEDIERSLDAKARTVSRRKGDAKAQFVVPASVEKAAAATETEAAPIKMPQAPAAATDDNSAPIKITSYTAADLSPKSGSSSNSARAPPSAPLPSSPSSSSLWPTSRTKRLVILASAPHFRARIHFIRDRQYPIGTLPIQ